MSKSRTFVFTINNYTEELIEKLKQEECKYLIFGKEIAPTTGTPHLQGYIVFHNPRSHEAIKKLYPWYIVPKFKNATSEHNKAYCSKEATDVFEKGICPTPAEDKGLDEKNRWKRARELAKEGRFDEIDDDIYIRYQSSFKRIYKEDTLPRNPKHLEECCGIWIWGPPGTGKSHMARMEYNATYDKLLNADWSDYRGENVLADDWGPEHIHLGFHVKRWTDKWTFRADWKYGGGVIRPPMIVFTSNYQMHECFTPKDYEAIKRRFKVIHLTEKYYKD